MNPNATPIAIRFRSENPTKNNACNDRIWVKESTMFARKVVQTQLQPNSEQESEHVA